MEDKLNFMHYLQELSLAYHHSIKFYLNYFDFFTGFAEFELTSRTPFTLRVGEFNRFAQSAGPYLIGCRLLDVCCRLFA